ncbi:MAG TPA: ATP-binding protein [Terracidiphilus sp.]|nr:ATP-binding protein [Terracidiphilus sp.]
MSWKANPRLRWIVLLAVGVLAVFVLLGGLNAFNTSSVSFLNPETSGETLALTGLTVFLFLLLIAFLLLLLRNLLKLYMDQGSSALGARLRNRMVLGAALIALTPAVFMFLFSSILMNRTIDRWFSPNASELREDSTRVVLELAQYVASNARGEAASIAASGAPDQDAAILQSVLTAHRLTLDGGFVVIYGVDRRPITAFDAPPESTPASLTSWLPESNANGEPKPPTPLSGPLYPNLLATAQRTDQPILRINDQEYALGSGVTPSGKVVLAALPMPQGLSQSIARIRQGSNAYWELFRQRRRVRDSFFLLLLLVTVVVFFASVWLAMFLAKQITRPVAALADAMDGIATGKYQERVGLAATGEMAELVGSFNHMAADLETSRQRAETSSAQLTAANQALEERRRWLETIMETIPSGLVTLDAAGVVVQANRAFAALTGQHEDAELRGAHIESLFPPECADELGAVIRRGHRMGAASTEIELHVRGRTMHLAVTSARLDQANARSGTVLVVEDTTELLRAQRQLAWKEVAQRVAHEIKNPLTPIALSAERIGRHLDRGQGDSTSLIRKCSEVILSSVGTLRTLVDQFSALAQFPAPQPRPCDLNRVAEEALALFHGRLEDISVKLDLAHDLPPVLADHEAIRRALANLIDNAAEAMQGSLLRVLAISTAVSEDGAAVEVSVSDTGHGLTDEIRERLFLPFYSTKHRGTGLGLAIAAKIVQEHGGNVRAESNTPKGARFLVRIPLMEPANGHAPEADQPEHAREIRS